MKKDKKFYLDLYNASSIGFSVVFSILIGGGIGLWIDKKFDTSHHWAFFIFLIMGIVAGFENMYRGIKKYKDENNDKKT